MKRKTLFVLMGAVFAVLLALLLFANGLPTLFSSLTAFPFEQLGALLHALAMTGSIGNGLALALCAAISALPVLYALRHRGERERLWENISLCCLSAAVFAALFCMAKPSLFVSAFTYVPQEALPIAKSVLGCMVWSLVVLWVILRLIRLFKAADIERLLGYLRTALYVLCLLFAAAVALSCGGTLLDGLSNTQMSTDSVLAVLRFIAEALPYVFDIAVTLSLLTLLEAYTAGNSEAAAKSAEALSGRCCTALGVTATTTAALNVIQLLLSRLVSNVYTELDIPVVSLVFVLLILILSRLVVQNRKLKNDNDLFI